MENTEPEKPLLEKVERNRERIRPIKRLLLLDVLSDRESRPVFYWAGGMLLGGVLVYHWLEGWSLCLSEMNYLRTGYRTEGLLDVHVVTDADIANRDSFAIKIGAVTDPAQELPLNLTAFAVNVSNIGRPGGPPQSGPHPRQQFARGERFGDVVVGARVQGGDLLLLVDPRRKDHDRQRRPFADAAHDRVALGVRQAQVE